MKRRIEMRADARAEFDAEVDWCGRSSSAAATKFARRVKASLDRVSANPLMHAVVYRDVRRAVVPRYPFCIYYRVHPDRVEVIAVFHTSRNPAEWQSRV